MDLSEAAVEWARGAALRLIEKQADGQAAFDGELSLVMTEMTGAPTPEDVGARNAALIVSLARYAANARAGRDVFQDGSDTSD